VRRAATAIGLACLLAVVGCSPAGPTPDAVAPHRTVPPPPGPPDPAPIGSAAPPLTAAQVREQAGTRYAGLSVAVVAAQQLEIEDRTGSIVLTVVSDADVDGPTVLVATDPGGVLRPQGDGSVVVLGAEGVPTAGIARPEGGVFSVLEPDLLGLTADTAAPSPGVTVWLAEEALLGLSWGEREGGRSLAVVPNDWTRAGGEAALALAWAQIVAAEPEVDAATMRDQLACHMLGAPDKETWNLEPWRPDVGLLEVLAARCNP